MSNLDSALTRLETICELCKSSILLKIVDGKLSIVHEVKGNSEVLASTDKDLTLNYEETSLGIDTYAKVNMLSDRGNYNCALFGSDNIASTDIAFEVYRTDEGQLLVTIELGDDKIENYLELTKEEYEELYVDVMYILERKY